MASSLAVGVLRRLSSTTKNAVPSLGKRGFHSAGAKQGAHGGGSGGELYSNDYLHAPHMYDLPAMKQRKLKMGLLVFGGLAFGSVVPIIATEYQKSKYAM
ncbi:hypothetical protein R1sor_003700 [Riccia sorocarpa]|uniref:Uncharacterized protein n=1 Tax=Riccia sorocarpa TaxID=122646 RepID=A0ABD3H2P7_9MARC